MRQLLESGNIVLRFGDEGNPHIRMFPDPSLEDQVRQVGECAVEQIVLYRHYFERRLIIPTTGDVLLL